MLYNTSLISKIFRCLSDFELLTTQFPVGALGPAVWGIRIQSSFALVRVLYHRLIVYLAFLHAVRRMSSDSWALGCPGSGNILFHRRMSYFFKILNMS